MKTQNFKPAFPSRLENDRDAALADQQYFTQGSAAWKRIAKRIAQIDAQIAATAERHVAWLIEWRAGCLQRGQRQDAAHYAARIAEIQGAQNSGANVRWSNEEYAETAKVAGGVLVIKTEVV